MSDPRHYPGGIGPWHEEYLAPARPVLCGVAASLPQLPDWPIECGRNPGHDGRHAAYLQDGSMVWSWD